MGRVMLDHEHVSSRDRERNAVYADWLIPLGLMHTAAATVRTEGGAQDFISFMRERDREPYSEQDKALLVELMPHITRGARLRARMGKLSHQAAMGLAALESLPQGMVLVDAQCRIQYANAAAERLMAPPSALGSVQGKLVCNQAPAQGRLQQLVAAACASQSVAGALESAGSPQRLMLTVLPLKAHHALTVFRQIPMVLVVMTMPDAMAALDPRLVGEMLSLSPTETRLALLLAAGKTVKDFALIEGCSWHTARTHAKNLLRKTGCHRQVELVQLLQSLRLG